MRRILTLTAACALLLAACGGGETEPSASQEPAAQEETAATVELAESGLGEILVDADGDTLYMFVPDEKANGEPTCYDECADAWPALEASGNPVAGAGLDQSLLAVVARTDGSDQVTYNGLPLYYFSGDSAAGDINGQGLNDVWWVLSAAGEPIRDDKEAADKNTEDKDDTDEGVGY